ncbi:MAG: hypothetical protein KDH96_04500 [Candidatus Riesia sp.]|nr:hypothetical protein [Candidatus Riesia sp.]
MFGFLAKIETLSESIQELVNRITMFADKFQKTVDDLVMQINALVDNVNDEITDDFTAIEVESVKLGTTGESFGRALVSGDNGLITITLVDTNEVYITNDTFTAKV